MQSLPEETGMCDVAVAVEPNGKRPQVSNLSVRHISQRDRLWPVARSGRRRNAKLQTMRLGHSLLHAGLKIFSRGTRR